MNRTWKLFLLLGLVGPVHMVEQMLFGIDEFYMLRDSLGGWYDLFPLAWSDHATVGLITVAGVIFTALFVALAAGGRARLYVLGFFGLFGISEAHHVIEAFSRVGYDPGLVTSIAYATFGALLFRSVIADLRRLRSFETVASRGMALARA